MFNIGMMELLLILLVAFLIVGPKDLPKVARWIARMIKKARNYIDQFKDDVGLDDLEAEVKDVTAQVEGVLKEADITDEVRAAQDALRAAAEDVDYEVRRTEKEIRHAVENE